MTKVKERPNYYSILPADVRYDKRLKANEKLLYSEITALANVNGYCFAKNSYFSELYGVSKETVSRWISNLQKFGYIKIELLYKENSKEISERKIHVARPSFDEGGVDDLDNTPMTKKSKGYRQKNQRGIDEKIKDNNTRYNTTSINSHHHGVHDDVDEDDVDTIIEKWNGLGDKVPEVEAINKNTTRYELLADRISEYGFEKVVEAIDRIKDSQFLLGNSKKSEFVIKIDWFLDGDNFSKVLEGNYDDKAKTIKSSYRANKKAGGESFTDKARKKRFRRMMESDVLYEGA